MIDVLVCYPDGTQKLEQREVPDDYFAAAEPEPEAESGQDAGEASAQV